MANGPNNPASPVPPISTSEAIDRAVNNSKELIDAKIAAMDRAVQVFQADLTRVPTQLDRAISGLRDLLESRINQNSKDVDQIHTVLDTRDNAIRRQVADIHSLMSVEIGKLAEVTREKFVGVAAQFSERDTRTDQRAGDTKLAVDAAFAAAKEATSKIEIGFTKSIDGLQQLLQAVSKSSDDKISDLKDRLTAVESRTAGISSANSENRTAWSDTSARMMAAVAIAVALVIGIAEIIVRLQAH